MSVQLEVHGVKGIRVLRDQKLISKENCWFTTTDVIAETEEGDIKVIFFGPKEGIPFEEKEEE